MKTTVELVVKSVKTEWTPDKGEVVTMMVFEGDGLRVEFPPPKDATSLTLLKKYTRARMTLELL